MKKNKRKKKLLGLLGTVTQSLFVTTAAEDTRIFTRKEITEIKGRWSITRQVQGILRELH